MRYITIPYLIDQLSLIYSICNPLFWKSYSRQQTSCHRLYICSTNSRNTIHIVMPDTRINRNISLLRKRYVFLITSKQFFCQTPIIIFILAMLRPQISYNSTFIGRNLNTLCSYPIPISLKYGTGSCKFCLKRFPNRIICLHHTEMAHQEKSQQ